MEDRPSIVIVAGGLGTRISDLYNDIPKCLAPVAGKPILSYQLELALQFGLHKCFILTGYLGDKVEEFVRRECFGLGIDIRCIREQAPLGTAGAFHELIPEWDVPFLVFYGDIICNFDINRFIKFHESHDGIASLVVRPNDHPYDSDLILKDSDDRIVEIYKKPRSKDLFLNNLDNAAVYLLEKEINKYIPAKSRSDWAHDVFPTAMAEGEELYGYRSSEYFKDIGSPARIQEVENDITNGVVQKSTYTNKRPCIFFNIDVFFNSILGSMNYKNRQILINLSGIVRMINRSEVLCIGLFNNTMRTSEFSSLESGMLIKKMETLLGEEHVYFDDILTLEVLAGQSEFYGEGKDLSNKKVIAQQCKETILQASFVHNIDLSESYLIVCKTMENQEIIVQDIMAGVAGSEDKSLKSELAGNMLTDLKKVLKQLLER